MKNKKIILFLSLSFVIPCFFTLKTYAAASSYRLFGRNRYETSLKIAERYNSNTINNVILVSGESFPDALSASVLAHKISAPILLVNSTIEGSLNAFDYISKHLNRSGNIYIIGSATAAKDNFTSYLNQTGYKNIIDIGNNERYNTNYMVAQQIEVPENTPVVISSGENYPDALGISSFAAYNNWPILLVPNDALPDKTGQFLQVDKPSKVYITGGTGVITSKVEEQIRGLTPDSEIIRFADALSGSVLAAQTGEPIVLIDPAANTVPSTISPLLYNYKTTFQNIISFGGTAVVPESVVTNAKNITSGLVTADNNASSDNVEKRIKAALINKTSYLFKISGEYTFMPGAGGSKTYKDENGTTNYKQSTEWAQNSIKDSPLGFIRIDEGNVSMEDSTNYTCSLKINGNDEGISISIHHVESNTCDLQLNGTIKGNMLTASEQVITAFYSPFTKSGFGTSVSGQYIVGLVDVPEEQWPPIPVALTYSINEDKSVTLTWKDKNPSTLVGYYEIYRMVGVTNEYTKVATVSNQTTWIDSSSEVKDEFINMLDYYIIAYSKTGIKSPISNHVIFSLLH